MHPDTKAGKMQQFIQEHSGPEPVFLMFVYLFFRRVTYFNVPVLFFVLCPWLEMQSALFLRGTSPHQYFTGFVLAGHHIRFIYAPPRASDGPAGCCPTGTI